MDVDMLKRHVAHVVQPREHHSGNPQSDDVAGGDKDGTRVEEVENFVCPGGNLRFQIRNFRCCASSLHHRRIVFPIRPAERCMWPKRRTKPCVENIGILNEAHLRQTHVKCVV